MTDTLTFSNSDEDKDVGEPDGLFGGEDTKGLVPFGFWESWEVQAKTNGVLITQQRKRKVSYKSTPKQSKVTKSAHNLQ